jgi:YebC/PmpR family DNA-binding regulatory protein
MKQLEDSMSGHSKWSTIKHKKGAADAKRGKIFTKILKEISISAKGGADPAHNPRLRLAVERAKVNNVPKDNIDRAIKRGTGELEGINYEEYTYEGYGPCGIAILVEVSTDNKNRTGGEVRSIFTKSGNSLAEAGAVAWNFERKGMITVENVTEDDIFEKAMELGSEDIESIENGVILYCSLDDLYNIHKALLSQNYKAQAELTMKPKNVIEIKDKNDAQKLIDLIDKLEDHDDVNKVYANFDISQNLLEELS